MEKGLLGGVRIYCLKGVINIDVHSTKGDVRMRGSQYVL